jgi:hypothetical protein
VLLFGLTATLARADIVPAIQADDVKIQSVKVEAEAVTSHSGWKITITFRIDVHANALKVSGYDDRGNGAFVQILDHSDSMLTVEVTDVVKKIRLTK